MRFHWLAVVVVGFLGCESLRSPPPPVAPPAPMAKLVPVPPLTALRQTAVVPVAVTAPPDPLSLAAECLERGDPTTAATHVEVYVRTHPEQVMFRVQLAELLVRAGKDDAARVHYERFVTDVGRATGAPRDHLVHAHTRLM